MKKLTVVAALAATFLATPALAQENAKVTSGPRIEVIVGWDRVSTAVDGTSDFDSNDDGFSFGAGLGYDVVAGSVLFGVEAEIAESTTGSSVTVLNEDIGGSTASGTVALDAAEDIYVGGRVGAILGGNGVLYMKAGYSMAGAELTARGTIDGERIDELISADFDGLRFGAGFENNFGNGLFAKIEYRYSTYGGASVSYQDVSVEIDDAFDYIDLDRHQAVVGLGYRF